MIGEMLELGRKSRDFHFEAGRDLGGRFDVLVAVRGDAAALAEDAADVASFATYEGLTAHARAVQIRGGRDS